MSTFIIGAAEFVVQDALDTIKSLSSNKWSFTPTTTVRTSSPFAGAEMRTFLAPAFKCLPASSLDLKIPVDSRTTSMSYLPQAIFSGSRSARKMICFPFSNTRRSPSILNSCLSWRWTLSYLSKWAKVLISARSFTTATSTWLLSSAILVKYLPILPNPLTPTLFIPSIIWVKTTKIIGSSQWILKFHLP